MNRKFISSGAFAAVAAIVAASSFISCSSDDEYYENGNYTLANKRMTRSTETYTPLPSDTIYTNYNFVFNPVQPYTDQGVLLPAGKSVHVDVMTYKIGKTPYVQMIGYSWSSDFIVTGVSFKQDGIFPDRYILCAVGTYIYEKGCIIEYYGYEGVVPNRVF